MKWLKSKGLKRTILAILGVLLALISYGLLQLIDPVPITSIAQSAKPQFAGRALLVASDADMVASAYGGDELDRVPGIRDTLTVIGLPLKAENSAMAQVEVSNSVTTWPQIVTTSPDGTTAYITESRSQLPESVQQNERIANLPEGSLVTVVDLSNLSKPTVLEAVRVGRNPGAISMSPDGRYLAIGSRDADKELVIIQTENRKLGRQFRFTIPNSNGQPTTIFSVSWHPSGRILALNLDTEEVAFYEVQSTGTGAVSLKPLANPVPVGNTLGPGQFTPDGRFYLISDLKWNTRGNESLNFLMNPKGEMVAIRVDETGKPPEVVSRAEVGLSPEGFDISPDGSLIATANLRRTLLPKFLPWRGKSHCSISLVTLNRDSGQLTTVDEYGFEGLLTENIKFDAEGKSLAATIFHYQGDAPKTGAVEFWNVVQGSKPRLDRTGYKIDVPRGPHTMAVIS